MSVFITYFLIDSKYSHLSDDNYYQSKLSYMYMLLLAGKNSNVQYPYIYIWYLISLNALIQSKTS